MAIGDVSTIDGINYVEVDDSSILNLWECQNCENSIAQVDPIFYEDAGTPICEECGEDMVYKKSLIKVSALSSPFHK